MTDTDGKVPLTTGNKMIGWLKVDPETLAIEGKFLGAEYAQFVREGLEYGMLEFSFMAKAGTAANAELWQKRFKEFLEKEEPKTQRWSYWKDTEGHYFKQNTDRGLRQIWPITKEEYDARND
jgi:hypothetical protein